MPPLSKRFLALVLTHPGKIVMAFAVLLALSAVVATRFEIDASADSLLVKDNQLYLQSREADLQFAPNEFILVGIKPRNGELFSEALFDTIRSLMVQFAELQRVSTVNSILSVPLLSSASSLSLDGNLEELSWNSIGGEPQELRERLEDHPVYLNLLVNRDLTATAIQIVFSRVPELDELGAGILELEHAAAEGALDAQQSQNLKGMRERRDVINAELSTTRSDEVQQIYDIVDEYDSEVDFYLGGNYVLVEHLITIIKNDLVVFGCAILVIICVLLYAIFRDVRWVLVPVVCCCASVVFTMGAFGAVGMKATVISANFIALQLILTLAIVTHLIVEYQTLAVAEPERSHRDLLERSLQEKIQPCLFSGITTSVGFGALLFSGIQPVISFGLMMIIAVFVSIAVSLVLFPGILALWRQRLPARQHASAKRALDLAQRLSAHSRGWVYGVSAAFFVLTVFGFLRLDVENSFLNYFKDSTQIKQELLFIDREMGGSTPLDVIINPTGPADPNLVVGAEQMRLVQQVQATLDSSIAVGKTLSLANFTAWAQQINDGRPLTEYELNTLYRVIDEDLRDEFVESYFDGETGQLRVSARVIDSTEGFNRAEFLDALRLAIDELGLTRDQVVLTNLFVLYEDILHRLYTSQITTMGLVFLALTLVLYVLYREWRLAVIAIIPNILASFAVLGVMGWLGIPLDLMTITISAIAMGIAVDNTIHFIHHVRERREEGIEKAIHSAFGNVGYAILFTSLIIALGFSVLGFSDFVPSLLFGLLTALTMIVALLANLTLLPALLSRTGPSSNLN